MKIAKRNIKLCTKDCLCLYVCPTGASNTETGQIDENKCVGCGACVNACPSHALSLVPTTFPPQQKKDPLLKQHMLNLTNSKINQMNIASFMEDDKTFFKAIALSNKVMAEDIARESSYLLPQGEYTLELLKKLKKEALPEDILLKIERLIELL